MYRVTQVRIIMTVGDICTHERLYCGMVINLVLHSSIQIGGEICPQTFVQLGLRKWSWIIPLDVPRGGGGRFRSRIAQCFGNGERERRRKKLIIDSFEMTDRARAVWLDGFALRLALHSSSETA